MPRHTHHVTIEIGHSTLSVDVEFDATAAEPMVRHLPNGDPGYPGSDASAEMTSVHVTDWAVGSESRERDQSEIWPLVDRMAASVLFDKWQDRYQDECLESIQEQTT